MAVAAIVLLAGINYVGVTPGAITVNVLTVLKLAALAAVIGVGLSIGAPAPVTDIGIVGPDRPWLLTLGSALVPILFAYGGWQQTNFMAEEIREPGRTLPRALVFGTLIVVTVYLLANLAYPPGARPDRPGRQHGARRGHDARPAGAGRRDLHRGRASQSRRSGSSTS